MDDVVEDRSVDSDEKPFDDMNWLENLNEADIDLRLLADKVYELLIQELRLERQRQGIHR